MAGVIPRNLGPKEMTLLWPCSIGDNASPPPPQWYPETSRAVPAMLIRIVAVKISVGSGTCKALTHPRLSSPWRDTFDWLSQPSFEITYCHSLCSTVTGLGFFTLSAILNTKAQTALFLF